MAWLHPGCFRSRMLNPPKVCPPDNPSCNQPGQGDASADGKRDGKLDGPKDGPLDGSRDGSRDVTFDGRDGSADRSPDGAEVARADVPADGKLDAPKDGPLDGNRDVRTDGRPDAYVCTALESRCGDGVDDDCNGYLDCKDPACMNDPVCIDRKKETCDNRIDDDGNGLVDCKDPACFGDQACVTPGIEVCNNNLDDDEDGQVDCADSDCAKDPTCQVTPGDEILRQRQGRQRRQARRLHRSEVQDVPCLFASRLRPRRGLRRHRLVRRQRDSRDVDGGRDRQLRHLRPAWRRSRASAASAWPLLPT